MNCTSRDLKITFCKRNTVNKFGYKDRKKQKNHHFIIPNKADDK